MTKKEILRRIEHYKPHTLGELRRLKIPHQFIGSGAFREAYKLGKYSLVIKLPFGRKGSKEWKDSRKHTNDEVAKIEHFAQFKALKPYLPEIFYHDRKHGVVVMKYYKPRYSTTALKKFREHWIAWNIVGRLVKQLTGKPLTDMGWSNVCLLGNNKAKFLDLGY